MIMAGSGDDTAARSEVEGKSCHGRGRSTGAKKVSGYQSWQLDLRQLEQDLQRCQRLLGLSITITSWTSLGQSN
ncbi:hypothetical protein MHYP_G00284090 [Metynnis hypsauchen]